MSRGVHLPHTPHWEKFLRHVYPASGLPIVTRYPVEIANLSPALVGLRIVQLSDLHIDFWNLPAVESAIEQAHCLQPDLVMLTGDFIAHGNRYIPHLQKLLSGLTARYGVFACMGNHDYSDGDEGMRVITALKQADVQPLINEGITLSLRGASLHVAGVDDVTDGKPVIAKAAEGFLPGMASIVLLHNPRYFPQMAAYQPNLVLSGHTHGGQIKLPFLSQLAHRVMNSRFVAGHYVQGQSRLYVNRGIGSAIIIHKGQNLRIPTLRLNVQPEVTLFELYPTGFIAHFA